jgi:ABC-type polysaccharide/polyol phosphate export permease
VTTIHRRDRRPSLRPRSYADMFTETWRGRYIFTQLVRRDFMLRTKSTFFGFFWSLSQPLLWLVLFTRLQRTAVFDANTMEIAYPVYAFTGIIHWQLFANVLVRGSGALIDASNLVTKVRLPRETLVFARCASALVDWLFSLPVLGMLLWWYDVRLSPSTLLLPISLIPLILLAVSLALVSSVIALPFRDLLTLIQFILTPLMFVSSVLYASPNVGGWSVANDLNPMVTWLGLVRALLYGSAPPDRLLMLVWCGVSIVLFLICWRFFFLVVPRVAEQA